MWRKFHLLGPVQVFVVSSLSAAIIAVPIGVASISNDETVMLRDLVWPHQFDPWIIFSSVFVSLIPVLLAYYHLGRIGAMLSLAVSVVTWYAMVFCALFVFLPREAWFGAVAYGGVCLLLYALLFQVHTKAATSLTIRQAQRALRLVSQHQTV